MEILLWLLVGLIAGVLGMVTIHRTLPSEPIGWVGAILVGLIGGFVGGWVFSLLGLEIANWIGSLVVAFAGAVLVLWILQRAGIGGNPAERT